MEINQDLIMQFGLMQKLSTGYPLLDALLVMLLPILFSRVMPHLHNLLDRWQQRSRGSAVRREIAHTYKARHFDYSEDGPPNHKLQAAILVHLNTLPNFAHQLVAADVKLVKAPKQQEGGVEDGSDDNGSEISYHWYPDMELEDYELKLVPPMDEVVTLAPDLTFCRSQALVTTSEGTSKSDELTVTFTLASSSTDRIDAFVSTAYESYRAMIKGQRDRQGKEQRYLYLPVLSGAESTKEGDFTFRAYPLTDDKDFGNFFHQEKDDILRLVEAFNNKTGKFAIKGYPQKLGFLLYGPPGTGKTSFIKHTKRSIINIPLSRIKTNQQLMSLMMDQTVRVAGDEYCRPLPHSKTIYVCEDVDAASHVVQKRAEAADPVAAALCSIIRRQAREAAESEGLELQGPSAAADKQLLDKAKAAMASDGAAASLKAAPLVSTLARGKGLLDSGSDELNLAGLLNVLDGVVDTPGRLLVLSTNHPEQLDPALIRAGRINRKVYMGYMARPEALQLVTHYFGDLSLQQQAAFAAAWKDDCVSPAALEALCAECEEFDSLVKGVTLLMSHSEAHCSAAAQHVAAVGAASKVPAGQSDSVASGHPGVRDQEGGGSSSSNSTGSKAREQQQQQQLDSGGGNREQELQKLNNSCEGNSCEGADMQAEGLASGPADTAAVPDTLVGSSGSCGSSSGCGSDGGCGRCDKASSGSKRASSSAVVLRASSCSADVDGGMNFIAV